MYIDNGMKMVEYPGFIAGISLDDQGKFSKEKNETLENIEETLN